MNQLVDSDFLKEGDEVVAFVTDHPREGIICREHGTFGIKDNISGTFYTHPSTWVSDEDVLVHCNKDLPKKSTAHGKKTAGYSGWDNVRVKRFDRSTGKTTNVTLTFVRDAYERRFGIKT